MDLWKRSAEIANIVSAAVAVYVLVRPQSGAVVNQVPIQTPAPDNLPLVVLCISVFSAAVLNFIALQRTSKGSIEQMVLPDNRVVTSYSLTSLNAILNKYTTAQVSKLLIGQWIKVSANVFDNSGEGRISVMIPARGTVVLALFFAKGWEEQLLGIRPGASLTARGRVSRVASSAIDVEECELL